MRKPTNARIHPDGYIIGGAHDKGMRYAAHARAAGLEYFKNQVAIGNIIIKEEGRRMRYRIKLVPRIEFGSPDELARMRAQHFLRNNANRWITKTSFNKGMSELYDNMSNAFKS